MRKANLPKQRRFEICVLADIPFCNEYASRRVFIFKGFSDIAPHQNEELCLTHGTDLDTQTLHFLPRNLSGMRSHVSGVSELVHALEPNQIDGNVFVL